MSGLGSRRRQFNAEGGRDVTRKVKLTTAQDLALRVRADALQVSVPRLLVESALAESQGETAKERADLLKQLFGAQRELAAVGNNVNQIAHVANASGELRADLERTLADVRETTAMVREAISGLSLDGDLT